MKHKPTENRTALILSGILLVLALLSLTAIFAPRRQASGYIAEVYQDGTLLMRIPLDEAAEPYRFTVTSPDGGTNELEVSRGGICVCSADCPDKLCVHQGIISDSRLPIICLPNRLVILLCPDNDAAVNSETPDMISY